MASKISSRDFTDVTMVLRRMGVNAGRGKMLSYGLSYSSPASAGLF
jgi:hypothetical protein